VQGKGIGTIAERYGWDAALYAILASTFLGILLLSLTWNLRPRAIGPDRGAANEKAPALKGGGA
jgi:sugar phosphate permease